MPKILLKRYKFSVDLVESDCFLSHIRASNNPQAECFSNKDSTIDKRGFNSDCRQRFVEDIQARPAASEGDEKKRAESSCTRCGRN
jgi:hypothetical protein